MSANLENANTCKPIGAVEGLWTKHVHSWETAFAIVELGCLLDVFRRK